VTIPTENLRPTATCINHPERAAVERCEVCDKPLCAYCLYYTDDGQRLCVDHARQAREAGAKIHSPAAYAEGLITAQISAAKPEPVREPQFIGDSADLLALIGLVIGIVSISLCIPIGICLVGPAGILVSAVALINAKNARDPLRTRSMATIGITLSSVWLLVILACTLSLTTNSLTFSRAIGPVNFNSNGIVQITVVAPINVQPIQPTVAPSPTAAKR
jgi:hypothetical protein